MKRFLFYVAILFGSLIAQAHPAVEFHDVTAAIIDSVRIVPNFSLGDSRSYRATVKTVMARSDSSSVDYHMKVESVDSDHYGMFLILDNFVYDQSYYPDSEQLVEFFGTEGFHFFFNRKGCILLNPAKNPGPVFPHGKARAVIVYFFFRPAAGQNRIEPEQDCFSRFAESE